MSHVATVDVEVKDLDALAQACSAIGLELVRGQQTYRCWYSTTDPDDREEFMRDNGWTLEELTPPGFAPPEIGKCSHVIRIKGNDEAYEIGIAQRRDGRPGYTLLIDDYDRGRGKSLHQIVGGKACNVLRQQYALAVTQKQAAAQGFTVHAHHNADGSIRVMLRK